MKRLRSLLFVPGNKPRWVEKAHEYGADALILDLEDSVPPDQKQYAGDVVQGLLTHIAATGTQTIVRINGLERRQTFRDLENVVVKGLGSLMLTKLATTDQIKEIDTLVSYLEEKRDLEPGSVKFVLGVETAKGMWNAHELSCASGRNIALVGGSNRGGDVNREIGYQWTKKGDETLYIRSKMVLASRAAGVLPIIGPWNDIKDLDGLLENARANRQFGFAGQCAIYPTHVPVIHQAFTPSEEEITDARAIIETMQKAMEEGTAATVYKGELVDIAMIKSAEDILRLAGEEI